ncbi:MAG: hypothetical protein ACT4PT_02110 [Methanobacteriota archaeon]
MGTARPAALAIVGLPVVVLFPLAVGAAVFLQGVTGGGSRVAALGAVILLSNLAFDVVLLRRAVSQGVPPTFPDG